LMTKWQRKLLEIHLWVNHTINRYFIVRRNVVQRAGQLSVPHVAISKTKRNKTINIKPMSRSYNTRWIKHKLVVSIYSNTETSLAMSTLAIWCRVVRSHDVSPHNFDGLAMSGFIFSVAPSCSSRKTRTSSNIVDYALPHCRKLAELCVQ